MAGYIGSKASVTQVDGYNTTEADAEFVAKAGDTMTGGLTVTGTVTATAYTGDGSALTGVGGSTTFGAVGTYSFVVDYGVGQNLGDTIAGSTIRPTSFNRSANTETSFGTTIALGSAESTLSGTWRIMSSKKNVTSSTRSYFFLVLRIS